MSKLILYELGQGEARNWRAVDRTIDEIVRYLNGGLDYSSVHANARFLCGATEALGGSLIAIPYGFRETYNIIPVAGTSGPGKWVPLVAPGTFYAGAPPSGTLAPRSGSVLVRRASVVAKRIAQPAGQDMTFEFWRAASEEAPTFTITIPKEQVADEDGWLRAGVDVGLLLGAAINDTDLVGLTRGLYVTMTAPSDDCAGFSAQAELAVVHED